MEPRAHHVLIGLFTVVIVSAILVFALWLGKSSADKEFDYYQVIFNEAVSGLSQGSAVQYSGIRVGDVTSLALDPQDPRKVHATIRINSATPIKEDTRARLTITNITGGAVIQLHGGSPQSPRLKMGKDGLATIVADRSPLSRLMANGEDLMVAVTRLLDRANAMFSRENTQNIAKTLRNLEQITASVAEQREELRDALSQIAAAGRETSALMNNANKVFSGPAQNTLDSAERLVTSLERTSSNIEQLLQDNRAALDGGMQGIGELGPAINELRDTLGSLRSFSRRLEEDPAGYLLRSDSIKEFQP